MIKPKLHHVNLKTSRLDEMIAWYEPVIGAKVQFRDQVAAWMTNDDANHRIAFLAVPGLSDDEQKTKHNGMHHCAFEHDSFEDLMTSFDRLRKAGINPAFCLDHGITISLYYQDPEGNFVELQSDVFGDWAKSGDFIRTSPDFAANPYRHFILKIDTHVDRQAKPLSRLARSSRVAECSRGACRRPLSDAKDWARKWPWACQKI